MTMTEKEKELFKSLADSGLGAVMVGYLEKVQAELCDVRTMASKPGTPEWTIEGFAAKKAADSLEAFVMKHLRQMGKVDGGKQKSQYS